MSVIRRDDREWRISGQGGRGVGGPFVSLVESPITVVPKAELERVRQQLEGAVALLREAQRSMHWDDSVPVGRRFRWATDVDALDPPTPRGQ